MSAAVQQQTREEAVAWFSCATKHVVGTLRIYESYLSFNPTISLGNKKICIPFSAITHLEKKKTVVNLVPNAIKIYTANTSYTFKSFVSRDEAHATIVRHWQQHQQQQQSSFNAATPYSALTTPRACADDDDTTPRSSSNYGSAVTSPTNWTTPIVGSSPSASPSSARSTSINAAIQNGSAFSNGSNNNNNDNNDGNGNGCSENTTPRSFNSSFSPRGGMTSPAMSASAAFLIPTSPTAATTTATTTTTTQGAYGIPLTQHVVSPSQEEAFSSPPIEYHGSESPAQRRTNAHHLALVDSSPPASPMSPVTPIPPPLPTVPAGLTLPCSGFPGSNLSQLSVVLEQGASISSCPSCVHFFHAILGESSSFFHDLYAKRGHTAFCASPWTVSSSAGTVAGAGGRCGPIVRNLEYVVRLNASVGPKSTRVVETQRCSLMNDSTRLVLECKSQSLDVPYADAFRVVTLWDLTQNGSESSPCKLSVKGGTIWEKSCMFKGLVEKTCERDLRGTFQIVMEKIRLSSFVEQHNHYHHALDAARSRRKRQAARTSSSTSAEHRSVAPPGGGGGGSSSGGRGNSPVLSRPPMLLQEHRDADDVDAAEQPCSTSFPRPIVQQQHTLATQVEHSWRSPTNKNSSSIIGGAGGGAGAGAGAAASAAAAATTGMMPIGGGEALDPSSATRSIHNNHHHNQHSAGHFLYGSSSSSSSSSAATFSTETVSTLTDSSASDAEDEGPVSQLWTQILRAVWQEEMPPGGATSGATQTQSVPMQSYDEYQHRYQQALQQVHQRTMYNDYASPLQPQQQRYAPPQQGVPYPAPFNSRQQQQQQQQQQREQQQREQQGESDELWRVLREVETSMAGFGDTVADKMWSLGEKVQEKIVRASEVMAAVPVVVPQPPQQQQYQQQQQQYQQQQYRAPQQQQQAPSSRPVEMTTYSVRGGWNEMEMARTASPATTTNSNNVRGWIG